MLNIYYEPDSKVYTFIQNNDENMFSMDMEELLIAVASSLALMATKKEGSLEEAYNQCAEELYEFGTRDCASAEAVEIISQNEDQIFMKNESKEQAIRHIAYSFKEGVADEAKEFAEYYEKTPEEFEKELTDSFIELMKDTYDVDITSVFTDTTDYEDNLF